MTKRLKNPPEAVDLNLLSRESLIRLPDVLRATGERRTTFLRGVKEGKYPKPYRIGKRAVAWRYGEILSIERERVL